MLTKLKLFWSRRNRVLRIQNTFTFTCVIAKLLGNHEVQRDNR